MKNQTLKSEIDELLGEKQILEKSLRSHEPCNQINIIPKGYDPFDPTLHIMSCFGEISEFNMND